MINYKHNEGVKIIAEELIKLGIEVQYSTEREMPIDIIAELQNNITIVDSKNCFT